MHINKYVLAYTTLVVYTTLQQRQCHQHSVPTNDYSAAKETLKTRKKTLATTETKLNQSKYV